MGKNSAASSGLIERLIKKYIEDDNVVFVFPTEIAASMWQERALDFHPRAVLPNERFMAWDRFKSLHAARAEAGKAEVTEQVRELYAESLAQKNAASAAKGKLLLRSVIPAEFAESASLFSPWIAGILPHLALWKEKKAQVGKAAGFEDAEDKDIDFIFKDYKAFLDRHSLFEPDWCRRVEGAGKKHIIFFYEAIQGFSAYEAALRPKYVKTADELPVSAQLADFTAVKAPPFAGEIADFSLCDDFHEEFRRVALQIEKLLREKDGQDGEDCNSIAVSLSDAQESEPYLSRELATRGIPFYLRFGRPIAETGAGRIFPLIQQCKAENFSFSSVKKLVSLKSIAWSNPGQAADLVQFGIKNRCLCAWEENGERIDAWERAFRLPGKNADFRIEEWYKKLKRNVMALCGAKSFAAVRKAWFDFSRNLLDARKMGLSDAEGEENKTKEYLEIGRCLKELDALVEAEQSFPELAPSSHFSFFVARLKKTTYAPQSKEGGVSVFSHKDAAAAPFKFHFVTGATQEDATALHVELRFLRKDKRDALACIDEDASNALFSSYMNGAESGGRVFFSAALRGVGGHKTVHSAFGVHAGKDKGDDLPDPLDDPLEMEERQEKPHRIYPAQRNGFEAYSALNSDKANRFSFLKKAFEGNVDAGTLAHIKERIAKKGKNSEQDVRVSATDLNAFAECPAKWLLQKALRLETLEFSPELDIVDAGEKGNIFHEVAESLYKLIKGEGGAFCAGNAERYLEEADKIIRAAIKNGLGPATAESPLGALACPALAARLKKWVQALVEADSKLLDGFIPVITEDELCCSEDGIEYAGKIDRISESEGGESTVIVDYKTGACPGTKDCKPDADGKIKDFQMPFYAFLCKKELKKDATQAWFFSVKKPAYVRILDTDDGVIKSSSGHGCKSAEEFESAIEAMKKEARAFAKAVTAADFSAEGVYFSDCQACGFKAVCRRAYSVARD